MDSRYEILSLTRLAKVYGYKSKDTLDILILRETIILKRRHL